MPTAITIDIHPLDPDVDRSMAEFEESRLEWTWISNRNIRRWGASCRSPDLFRRVLLHADLLRCSGMFERSSTFDQSSRANSSVTISLTVDLAVFEIKVDVFRVQDSGLDLNR
jgi:hypothetical protein